MATLFVLPESYSERAEDGPGREEGGKKDARLLWQQPATVCAAAAGIGGAATNARKESPRRTDGRREGAASSASASAASQKNRAHTAEEIRSCREDTDNIMRVSNLRLKEVMPQGFYLHLSGANYDLLSHSEHLSPQKFEVPTG